MSLIQIVRELSVYEDVVREKEIQNGDFVLQVFSEERICVHEVIKLIETVVNDMQPLVDVFRRIRVEIFVATERTDSRSYDIGDIRHAQKILGKTKTVKDKYLILTGNQIGKENLIVRQKIAAAKD